MNPWTTKNGTAPSDAAARYDWGDTSNRRRCAWTRASSAAVTTTTAGTDPRLTTYLVRANTTPFDPNAAPIVNQGTCSGLQIPGFDKIVQRRHAEPGRWRLRRPDGERVPPMGARVHVRPLDGARRSDYLLQIRTNVAARRERGRSGQRAENTGGSNRFAVRAAWVTGGSSFTVGTYTSPPTSIDSNGITIAGVGYMGLFANAAAGAARPNFYMARVLPGAAARRCACACSTSATAAGACGSPTLTFKKPGGANWDSCKVRIGESNAFVNLRAVQLPRPGANGLWTTVDIPIPATYSCTIASATDCWTTMTYALAGCGWRCSTPRPGPRRSWGTPSVS